MKNQRIIIPYLLFFYFFCAINCSNLTDFTYTQYTITGIQNRQNKIHLYPQRSIFEQYDFPKACQITQLLNKNTQNEDFGLQISNLDEEINVVKEKVAEFLKLSNRAELLKNNIRNAPLLKNDMSLKIDENLIVKLEQHESKLKEINQKIDIIAVELERLVYENMKNRQNPVFKSSALNFEKRALEQRITLFEKMLQTSRTKKEQISVQNNERLLNNYFSELKEIFNSQSSFIDTIDTLLKNHNELAIIKAKISSIKAQIKMYDLVISEKQECEKEYNQIKQKQKHDQQVIRLIETLRLKKKQFNEPNKYCQGVVEKLTTRIKNLLIAYDYTFVCLHGLDEARLKRSEAILQLNEAERKLDDLQMSKGVSEFKRNFQHNRQLIKKKMDELAHLQLDPYYQDPASIQLVISASKRRISEITNEIHNLPVEKHNDWPVAERQIRAKIHEIQHLKGQYCQQNQLYERQSKSIEDQLHKLQEQEQYNHMLIKLQSEKIEQLERLKLRMAEIQQMLVQFMK